MPALDFLRERERPATTANALLHLPTIGSKMALYGGTSRL